MDSLTRANLEALEDHRITRVYVLHDSVELAVPESEGWRLMIGATLDEHGHPALEARWKPGMGRLHARERLERLVGR